MWIPVRKILLRLMGLAALDVLSFSVTANSKALVLLQCTLRYAPSYSLHELAVC